MYWCCTDNCVLVENMTQMFLFLFQFFSVRFFRNCNANKQIFFFINTQLKVQFSMTVYSYLFIYIIFLWSWLCLVVDSGFNRDNIVSYVCMYFECDSCYSSTRKKNEFVFSPYQFEFWLLYLYLSTVSFFRFCCWFVNSTAQCIAMYSRLFLLQSALNVLEKFHTSFIRKTDITKGKQRSISLSLSLFSYKCSSKWVGMRMRVSKRYIVLPTENPSARSLFYSILICH